MTAPAEVELDDVQYRRDVRQAMNWMLSSPDRIDKARRLHVEDAHGHCAAVCCRGLAHPCLVRWIADEALTFLLERYPVVPGQRRQP